jgi:hypothetical protein
MREQYEAEVQNVLDKYDELEHCELYADINDDDGVYVYFGASFTFRYFMPGIQNTYEYEIEREDQKLIQKIMDINLDFDPEFKMTRRTTAIELEVRFFGTGNPDDFDSFAYDVYNVDSYKYPEVYNKIFTIILGYEDMPLADNLNTLKIFDQEYGEIEDIEINIAAPSTGNPSDQPNKEDIKNIINDSMKRRMTSIVSNQTFFDFYEDDMDTLRTHIIVNNLDFHLYGPHTMKGGAFVSNQPSGLIQYQLSIPREEVLRLGIQYFRLMESVWDAIQNEVFMQLQAEMKLKQVPLKSVTINNTNVQPVPEKDVNVQPTDEDPETIKESCSNWYKNFRLTAKA